MARPTAPETSNCIMSISQLKSYLTRHGASFEELRRTPSENHAPVAMTKIVTIDDELAMAVLPVDDDVDLKTVSAAADGARVGVASEDDIRERFPIAIPEQSRRLEICSTCPTSYRPNWPSMR